MRLDSFRALTFDCYGTLIDWESGLLALLLPWATRAEPRSRDRKLADLAPARASRDLPIAAPSDAHRADALAERLLAAFGESEPVREAQGPDGRPGFQRYPDVLRAVMTDIAAALGVDPAGASTRAAAEALANSIGDWPAFPDTPAALASLQRRRKLVIVSNVDRASFARTNEKLGVTFDAIVTAEDVRSYKPAPAHFHRALEALAAMGVAKHEVLHVAQSLFHDHVPAKALGLATCWVRRPRAGDERGSTAVVHGAAGVSDAAALVRPDLVVDTMGELATLMADG